MGTQDAAKIAKDAMKLAEAIARKPEDQRRIVMLGKDLDALADAKDDPMVAKLRSHCAEHGIKFKRI